MPTSLVETIWSRCKRIVVKQATVEKLNQLVLSQDTIANPRELELKVEEVQHRRQFCIEGADGVSFYGLVLSLVISGSRIASAQGSSVIVSNS